MDEGKITFTRPFRLVLKYPSNFEKGEKYEEPKVSIKGVNPSNVIKKSTEEGFVYEFTATPQNREVSIQSNYFSLSDNSIDPTKEGNKTLQMNFVNRHVSFVFIYEAWEGGYNYSYMTSNDMNGDGYNYDAVYIPTDDQVKNGEMRFVSQEDAERYLAFIHNDKYLSKHQGEYAEGYSVYSPWVHRLDFSYKHDFKVKCGNNVNTLQLGIDVKNLLNLFNSSWGVSKIMNSSLASGRILKYEGADAEGYATFSTPKAVSGSVQTWLPSYSVGQCWYASVGIRYMFN